MENLALLVLDNNTRRFSIMVESMGTKKLRILILLHWMRPDGSGIYFKRLASNLNNKHHQVTVCSTGGELVAELEKENIGHHRFVTLSRFHYPFTTYLTRKKICLGPRLSTFILLMSYIFRWSILSFLEIFRIVRIARRNNIDIVHSHGTTGDIFGFICSKFLRRPWVTLVSTPAVTTTGQFAAFGSSVRRVIAISDECRDAVLSGCSVRALEKRIVVIPNFVDTNRFSPPKSTKEVHDYLREMNIPPNRRNIVLISRLDRDKEAPIISTIRAAPLILKEAPDTQIIIVGTGGSFNDVAMLAEEMNKKIGRKAIFMTGFLKDVEKAMKIATLVIAVGQTAAEAMACGKPVIIAGHRRGVNGGSFGGVVDEDTVAELQSWYFTGRNSSTVTNAFQIAKACISLLRNEKRIEGLGLFSRHVAEKQFDIEQGVARILDIYYSLLSDRDSRRKGREADIHE